MRHLKIVYEFFVITVVMYLVRPIEAILCACGHGIMSFYKSAKHEFRYKMWYTSNLTPRDLYKVSIDVWRDGK